MPPKHSADSYGQQNVPVFGDNSDSVNVVEAARNRSDGFDIGADRAITNPPNWENVPSSQELWNQANLGNDPSTATAISQSWSAHSIQLSQASNDLYNAISELGAVWIGQGAAGAQGALVAIANSSSQASAAAKTMSDRLQKQADAATKVKLMPRPTDYSPEKAMSQALAAGPLGMVTDQKPLADKDKEVRAEQARFLEAYTKEMSEVDSSTPSFGPESLGMKPTATHNSASFSGVSNLGNANLNTGAVSGTPVPGPHGFVGGAYGAAAAAVHGGPDAGVFSQSGYTPSAAPAGPGVGAGAGAAPITPPSTPPSTSATGGSGLGQALTMGALGGGLGYAGAKALGQGNRSGSKDTDSTESAATDNAPAQSAASHAVPQQGFVPSSGTIGGGATPPPMQGMGGMGGGMGAHGAHAEQEEEHTHASFLIEPDPDDAFGANEATPPPVIGAWTEDDDR